jgi:excinuclease ABC subunit B
VAILDADKEGFLRSSGSLIQTMGRAARNVNGRAVLYADVITDSMKRAIGETERRRQIQQAYNEANGITPQTIVKPIDMSLVAVAEGDYVTVSIDEDEDDTLSLTPEQRDALISELEVKMRNAAKAFEFEKAARFRDRIKALKTSEVYEDASTSRSHRRG